MLRKLFIILLAINAMPLISSATVVELRSCDTLNITRDLDSAYTHYISNQQGEFFEGYTIQLFSGNRSGANVLKGDIIARGNYDAVRLVYLAPNFKIQVGSFPDIGSAQRALIEWKSSYPDAFVVKTRVPWYPIELPLNVPADTTTVVDEHSPE
ncbi:SPOR domain-containing protein [Schleiferiaceae bacterium]|jgi:hypothetical protein|nr:SPOR domain-containing protein [Schleiferiaceae bacterium]